MAAQTKSELVEELAAHVTKDDLVKVLGSKLKKDELADVVDDNGDATKEQLVRKLGSRTKDALVQAGRISRDEAVAHAGNPDLLRMGFQGVVLSETNRIMKSR